MENLTIHNLVAENVCTVLCLENLLKAGKNFLKFLTLFCYDYLADHSLSNQWSKHNWLKWVRNVKVYT